MDDLKRDGEEFDDVQAAIADDRISHLRLRRTHVADTDGGVYVVGFWEIDGKPVRWALKADFVTEVCKHLLAGIEEFRKRRAN